MPGPATAKRRRRVLSGAYVTESVGELSPFKSCFSCCNMADSDLRFPDTVNNVFQTFDNKEISKANRLLQKRDSGYISPSPITPGSTPDIVTPSKTKTLHLSVHTPVRSASSPASTNTHSEEMQRVIVSGPNRQLVGNGTSILKKTLSSPGALDGPQGETQYRILNSQKLPTELSDTSHRILLGHQQQQQQQQQHANFECDGDDLSIFYLAFKCREQNFATWMDCSHPYCVQTRTSWEHMKKCFNKLSGDCTKCNLFENTMYRHAESCTEDFCPVEMCKGIKQQLRHEYGYLPYNHNNPLLPRHLQRRNSLGSYYYGGDGYSSFLLSLNQLESGYFPEDSPTARFIGKRADEIIDRLDREEPLLPPEVTASAPPTSTGRPSSLISSFISQNEEIPYQMAGGLQGMLSPIAERSEEIQSPSSAIGHHSLLSQQTHPSLMSSSLDGITDAASKATPLPGLNSLLCKGDIETKFPRQEVLHKFRTDYLTLGPDGHYYQRRDYNANDIVKCGGFGTIRFATDLTNKNLFAIKCNNKDDESCIDSIKTEARMLSRIGMHTNVIQMYAAVIDVEESECYPTTTCKLMIELAEHGNLSSLLRDPETQEPMPLETDQALYYFWQLLEGVNFLHKNGILHLDIKGLNVLLFDEGRTLKICDFGTAVRVDEIASKTGKNLGTPQFAAPEVCKQQEPHFSSDIWSTMCVLVEMLTGRNPWDHRISKDTCHHHLIYMIGSYQDGDMERDLIPPTDNKLEPDILDLMGLVFRVDHKQRPTAMELLTHPLINTAYTYESVFDDYDDECEEQSNIIQHDEEIPYVSHVPAPTSLSLSLEVLEENQKHKRLQKDSGMVLDLEAENGWIRYGRMTSSGRSSDSGLDTPQNILEKSFIITPCLEESDTEIADSERAISEKYQQYLHIPYNPAYSDGAHHSLPTPDPNFDPVIEVQRSFSLSLPNSHSPTATYSMSPQNSSYNPNWFQRSHCTCSYSNRLRHSNSAPAIGCEHKRRRLSLQSLHSYSSEEPNGKLRRTSSEVYVDRGPDVDSPHRVRKYATIKPPPQELPRLNHPLRDNSNKLTPSLARSETTSSIRTRFMPPLGGCVQCGGNRTEVTTHVTRQGCKFETCTTLC